jgi:hypothetical protein
VPDPNFSTTLRDRVALSITGFDRRHLNAYIPHLQTSGQAMGCHQPPPPDLWHVETER